ncbi:thioredoxin domain-containing protein [Candidatus Dojkabacteria bacterium]|nr:thioredoxin domain-containing protein [Candidatus Dojkabacteria bacterium]
MKSSTGVFAISVVVALVMLVGLILFFNESEPPEPPTLPLQVVEYTDFQCPACKQFSHVGDELNEKFGQDLAYEFKHFPLESIHPRSYEAAVASEAAREQDSFKQYHDILFENQDNLEDEDFVKYAEQLELDTEKFKDDYENNEELKARVDEDLADAEEKGLNSTPTFYINKEKYDFDNNKNVEENINLMYEYIQDLIDQAGINQSSQDAGDLDETEPAQGDDAQTEDEEAEQGESEEEPTDGDDTSESQVSEETSDLENPEE